MLKQKERKDGEENDEGLWKGTRNIRSSLEDVLEKERYNCCKRERENNFLDFSRPPVVVEWLMMATCVMPATTVTFVRRKNIINLLLSCSSISFLQIDINSFRLAKNRLRKYLESCCDHCCGLKLWSIKLLLLLRFSSSCLVQKQLTFMLMICNVFFSWKHRYVANIISK